MRKDSRQPKPLAVPIRTARDDNSVRMQTPSKVRGQNRASQHTGSLHIDHNRAIDEDMPLPPITRASTSFPSSPISSSLPPLPLSPQFAQDDRDFNRSLFSNYKASQSSSRLHSAETPGGQILDAAMSESTEPGDGRLYASQKKPGSSPDLFNSTTFLTNKSTQEYQIPRRPVPTSQSSEDTSFAGDTLSGLPRKNKPRPFAHLLGRTRSTRTDAGPLTSKPSTPNRFADAENASALDNFDDNHGIKTAPLGQERDRSFRDMMSSGIRNRSVDRQNAADSESGSIGSGKDSARFAAPNSSGAFLSNLKSTSTKAADGLGKAGKGIFTKFARSASSGERDGTADENYVCKVINQPLVKQTRLTRISKRLEDSKDKTEFWMPSLPWRCIDYLNYKGTEEEGLYRIPGSGPKVRHWQRRFDTELDIDLFEEPELYDINIIGSMFKAWLRDLPTEILPKATQNRIADSCQGATETPQMLKDELSSLPPFNYYLLFAITCHLSLLHSYSEKNRMDFRNLSICFQPCLKIDHFCFNFLVRDWKNCWQGCWTEKDAMLSERRFMDGFSTGEDDYMPPEQQSSLKKPQPIDIGNGRGSGSVGSDQIPNSPRSPTKQQLPADKSLRDKDGRDASQPDQLLLRNDENSTPKKSQVSQQHVPSLSPVLPLSPIGM